MDLDWLKSRIDKSTDIDGALREAAPDICTRFSCDRLTIYRATEDGGSLVAAIQMGLEDFGAVKVRVDSNRSVAGHVAALRKLVNIADAYDEKELAPLQMKMRMFRAVDERTGYTTRQVLAAPIVSASTGRLLGVVELFNRTDKQRFPSTAEDGIVALCAFLAAVFAKETSRTTAA
jgi:signal transduction protein with GAF and PtsI domain